MKRKLTFITVILAYIALAVGIRLAGFNQNDNNLSMTGDQNPIQDTIVMQSPDPNPPSPPPPPPLDPPG